MNIAVLGTGMVGHAIATKLAQHGHKVMMGSRTRNNEKALAWADSAGENASQGSFAEAARFGEIVFDCTAGAASLEALGMAGKDNLRGKTLIQVGNPLDFSGGTPPSLSICNTDSLGEQAQRAFPETRVVKTLNTMNCNVMVNPGRLPGNHNVFICGNDSEAKSGVSRALTDWFGWKRESIIDLGDIAAARATEMLMPIWLRLYGVIGHADFNLNVVVGRKS